MYVYVKYAFPLMQKSIKEADLYASSALTHPESYYLPPAMDLKYSNLDIMISCSDISPQKWCATGPGKLYNANVLISGDT